MLRLFLAALALFAMPAQAATFVKYEASGTGVEIGSFGAPEIPGWIGVTAYVPLLGCEQGVDCRAIGNRLIIEDSRLTLHYAEFTFDAVLDGFPVSADSFMYGEAMTGNGTDTWWRGTLTKLTVSTVESDTLPPGQISVRFTQNVPEPATWAMMLAGFGLLGGALRRQQQWLRQSA
jgi:PEP-CTERM putative exosortase interaction domain